MLIKSQQVNKLAVQFEPGVSSSNSFFLNSVAFFYRRSFYLNVHFGLDRTWFTPYQTHAYITQKCTLFTYMYIYENTVYSTQSDRALMLCWNMLTSPALIKVNEYSAYSTLKYNFEWVTILKFQPKIEYLNVWNVLRASLGD